MAYEPVGEIASAYRHFVGEVRVTTLNKGMLEASVDWLTHTKPPQAASLPGSLATRRRSRSTRFCRAGKAILR